MPVKQGDKVKIEYEGKLEDGTVFDSTEKSGKPLEFEIGTPGIIKGFNDAIMGMEKDEEKEVTIPTEDAYGEPKDELRKQIPRDQLPPEAKEGSMLMMGLPNGAQLPVKIIKLDDKEATLDLNHPLAGKTLVFKIKVLDINGPSEEPKEEPKAE